MLIIGGHRDLLSPLITHCPFGRANFVWWSWGDLNPRPQAFFVQFYMCSRLI